MLRDAPMETRKTTRLDVHIRPDIKKLIEQAADVLGVSTTDCACATLVAEAQSVLDPHQRIVLGNEDRDRFLKALASDDDPNEALVQAARDYRYLQRFASQNQDKDVGGTYVAVEEGDTRVMGYYTLSSASIEFDEYPESAGLPHYPIPATLLARMAVDKQFQGKGILGPDLLLRALKKAGRHLYLKMKTIRKLP